MKIGFIKRDTTLIPRYTALVTIRLDERDVRTWSEDRPLKLKFLLIDLDRPSGHGAWTIRQVRATGQLAKGRVPRGQEDPSPELKRAQIEETTQWRQASYETADFDRTAEIEELVRQAVEAVEADCAEANNP